MINLFTVKCQTCAGGIPPLQPIGCHPLTGREFETIALFNSNPVFKTLSVNFPPSDGCLQGGVVYPSFEG